MWGGVGGTIPPKADENNIYVYGKILLAGPLFSVICGVFSIILFLLYQHVFFLIWGLMCFGMGFMCLIPIKLRTGIYYNDGTRFLRIKRNGQTKYEETEIWNVIEKYITDGEKAVVTEKVEIAAEWRIFTATVGEAVREILTENPIIPIIL